MDTKYVYEAAKTAFNCIGPADHVTVEFIGNGLEYDGNAWGIDTPHTGRFDVIEVDATEERRRIGKTEIVPVKKYEVCFYREIPGDRWNPPDYDTHCVGSMPSMIGALTLAVQAVIEDRLTNAFEYFGYQQDNAVKEEV